MSVHQIEEPRSASASTPWLGSQAIWRLGFRPFYLAAALFSALAIPLWMAQYFGWLDGSFGPALHLGLGWHMHEMVFGMVAAVVVGFLFTAAQAWTGLRTPAGRHLVALVLLWCAGRAAMLCAPPLLAALVDWLFVPLAAWPLLRVLQRAGNRRNYFLIVLLGLMAVANGLYHASALGWIALSPIAPVQSAILVVVLMESAIGTRVIPMFTRNGAPGTAPLVQPLLDRWALGTLAAAGVAWVVGAPGWMFAPLACAAALLVVLRLWRWQGHRTLGVPLLWILHFSYAWVALGLVLLALASFNLVSASAGFHALTVGSMAGLILGMMTRTALGHTGRPLKAGRQERAMFVLIELAALARVASALGWDNAQGAVLLFSAACWSLAFLQYVVTYRPYLTRARVDGKEG
jgi:uncharacterized protein involved in response to NO